MKLEPVSNNKSFSRYVRALHRDIGFLSIGLIIVYSLSGIVLIYRDTSFLKRDIQIEKKLNPGLEPRELGRILHFRDFKVNETEGEVLHFQEGTYNKSTGMAIYTVNELPFMLRKFINLHKSASKDLSHWLNLLFGGMLFFMAISSFWMFKKGTRHFRRGIYITMLGILFTILVVLI